MPPYKPAPAKVFDPGRLALSSSIGTSCGLLGGARCIMHLKLHANATTTPRIRAYIQHSAAGASPSYDLDQAKSPALVAATSSRAAASVSASASSSAIDSAIMP